jgi:1,2-diacylglycerol 3-beta-glucosyltransferase
MTQRSSTRLLAIAAGPLAAAPIALTSYVTLVSVAGLRRFKRPSTGSRSTRFVIAVPAHNEAASIGATLESCRLQEYPNNLFTVHVVADNCTDDTAAVVQCHGYEAHVRNDLAHPGKGPALNWLHDRLVASNANFDVAVIVDADTTLDQGFLAAMSEAFEHGAVVAQGYYSVRDPLASPVTSFRYAALTCRHLLRPLGRARLRGSCGLYGNGMAFQRDLLSEVRWTGHLVEDAEMQIELVMRGVPVTFVPDAVVQAEMPVSLDHAHSQNARWERGRIDLVMRFLPMLTRRAVSRGSHRLAAADTAVDLLVPPLSVLAASHLFLGVAGSVASLTGSRAARLCGLVHFVALLALVGHTIAGLHVAGADRQHLWSLLRSPSLFVWKLRLWMSTLAGGDVEWVRTTRNAERNPS